MHLLTNQKARRLTPFPPPPPTHLVQIKQWLELKEQGVEVWVRYLLAEMYKKAGWFGMVASNLARVWFLLGEFIAPTTSSQFPFLPQTNHLLFKTS